MNGPSGATILWLVLGIPLLFAAGIRLLYRGAKVINGTPDTDGSRPPDVGRPGGQEWRGNTPGQRAYAQSLEDEVRAIVAAKAQARRDRKEGRS